MAEDDREPKQGTFLRSLSLAAKVIRDVSTILGAVTAIYIAVVNFLPNMPIVQGFIAAADSAINPDRFHDGYVYYEVSNEGGLTQSGQLMLHPSERLPNFSDLSVGEILMSQSRVYLRPQPTRSAGHTQVFQIGSCFEILSLAREITQPDLRNARSGGWLAVTSVDC